MEQKIYLISYSLSNDGDRESNMSNTYASLESAREAMREDIELSKRDNFWYDYDSQCVNDDYIVDSGDDFFEVYMDGWYDQYHESWSILERVVDMTHTADKSRNSESGMEM